MRVLVNLKLWAVVILLVGSMSACLKDDDDSLNINVLYQPYVLQNDNGTFTPQVCLYGFDLESAYLNVDGKRINLTKVEDFIWEIKSDLYAEQLDSVPYGFHSLIATDIKGKSTSLSIPFSESKKKIGDINLAVFEYDEESKKIHIELADSVQNASAYYLMIKIPTSSSSVNYLTWFPYSQTLTLTGDNKLSAEVDITGLTGGKYYFAVGASYETTFKISDRIAVDIPIDTTTSN